MKRDDLGGCWIVIAALAAIVVVTMFSSCVGRLDRQSAVNDAASVSRDLAGEVAVAQRITDAEAARVGALANAEKNNRTGNAQLIEAQARATKVVAEAKTIDDDRRAKQVGYGGLALGTLLEGSGGTLALLGACMPFLFIGTGFVFGVGFILRRK